MESSTSLFSHQQPFLSVPLSCSTREIDAELQLIDGKEVLIFLPPNQFHAV
jgi:hypothetical protein